MLMVLTSISVVCRERLIGWFDFSKLISLMYNSVSEVVREALRLLEERDALHAMKLEALRQDINQGLTSLDNGEGKPLDIEMIKAKARAAQNENR